MGESITFGSGCIYSKYIDRFYLYIVYIS